ncbi:hypothetical protein L1Q87_25730, partial [Klebsiella pneumoniae]
MALTDIKVRTTKPSDKPFKLTDGQGMHLLINPNDLLPENSAREGANKQVISSQADSLIKISRIWADFFPAN